MLAVAPQWRQAARDGALRQTDDEERIESTPPAERSCGGGVRGVPEVDRCGDQQLPFDEGLRCLLACLPSSVEVAVVWSFVYLALRRSLELVMLCFRSAEAKEIEIL